MQEEGENLLKQACWEEQQPHAQQSLGSMILPELGCAGGLHSPLPSTAAWPLTLAPTQASMSHPSMSHPSMSHPTMSHPSISLF